MTANQNPPDKAAKPAELTVFITHHDAKCVDCGDEITRGDFLRVEKERTLCMDCADLGHLEFLPRGDAALSRRTAKYSPLKVVVLEWSRSRKRYERQGILALPESIDKADAECRADAADREVRRGKQRERAEKLDQEFIGRFAGRILKLYPGCPRQAAEAIAKHACSKHSGRVGRSAAAKALEPKAVELAVKAHIRHVHTNYDELLMKGLPRFEAREEVRGDVADVLEKWSK